MFEAVRTYPAYGMASLIYNNLLNLILGSVIVVYKKRATSAFFHIFHIFPHFFHIFPHFSTFFIPTSTFPNSCCKLHCSKEKMRLPKTLLMDTLILNLKPFLSESSKKVVPQNIFQSCLYKKV